MRAAYTKEKTDLDINSIVNLKKVSAWGLCKREAKKKRIREGYSKKYNSWRKLKK